MKTDVVVKIDFKIKESKKECLREEAKRLNVPMSYILQKLVDDHINNARDSFDRQKVSEHLVNVLHASKYIKDDQIKSYMLAELEALQCQM